MRYRICSQGPLNLFVMRKTVNLSSTIHSTDHFIMTLWIIGRWHFGSHTDPLLWRLMLETFFWNRKTPQMTWKQWRGYVTPGLLKRTRAGGTVSARSNDRLARARAFLIFLIRHHRTGEQTYDMVSNDGREGATVKNMGDSLRTM